MLLKFQKFVKLDLFHTNCNIHRAQESFISVFRYYSSSPYLKLIFILGTILWLLAIAYVFKVASVLAYGSYPLSADEVRNLRWKDTWDLIIHKP